MKLFFLKFRETSRTQKKPIHKVKKKLEHDSKNSRKIRGVVEKSELPPPLKQADDTLQMFHLLILFIKF